MRDALEPLRVTAMDPVFSNLLSAVVGGIIVAVVQSQVQQRNTAHREHQRAVIELFWQLHRVAGAHHDMMSGRGGLPMLQGMEAARSGLAAGLRHFAAVSAELKSGEREKAMNIYRLLVPLSADWMPEPYTDQDIVGGPLDALVDAYPDALVPLKGDAESWEDFRRMVEQHQGAPMRLVRRS